MSQTDFVSRGQALVAAGQFQEAVKVCRLGLLGRPATAEGRVVLGQALQALGRYDEVVAEMRVALDLDPTSVAAHLLTAEALLGKGDSEAGVEALHRASKLAPNDPRVQQLLDEVEHRGGGSEGDDTTAERPPLVAVPEIVSETGSGLIELDPELEGIEIYEDFDEIAARRRVNESRGAVANAGDPVNAPAPATLMLPAAPVPRDLPAPTRPPGLQVAAGKAEVRTTFAKTLALPSPSEPQQRANAVEPAMPHHLEPPMSLAQQQQAVDVARLFAEGAPNRNKKSGSAAVQQPTGSALYTTLSGLGGQPTAPDAPAPASAPSPRLAAPAPSPRPVAPAPSRSAAPAPAARSSGATAQTSATDDRSQPRVLLWGLLGIFLIGAGLFTGFQIRAMRLNKQIEVAREHTRDLAKPDTWTGWTAAADSLAAIAAASSTVENRAALARARALIAFEFNDRTSEAEKAVEALGGGGGIDGKIAAAYIALARSDVSAAKQFSNAAMTEAKDDPAALYVASQSALLDGDIANALVWGKAAYSKLARPLFGLGLARAYGVANAWDDALNVVDRVLAREPAHLNAMIERSTLLAASGRLASSAAAGKELRLKLEKLIAQPRTVSPTQVGFGNLALARVDFARNDLSAARSDVQAAAQVGLDDQRFAEQAVETLYSLGELELAQKAAKSALASWSGSKRLRIALAQIAVAQGRIDDALQIVHQADLAATPMARAISGQARLAKGEIDGARSDFEAAFKAAPQLEPVLVGRAWLDILTNQMGAATKDVVERATNNRATPAVLVVYAAVLRSANDAAKRDQARQILEKIVSGPPGPELARAHLELARTYRDGGDFSGARKAYLDASAHGSFEARLESGQLAIDDRDPKGGATMLNALLKSSGDHPPPALVVEVARARMLAGDLSGAAQLLENAAKLTGVSTWKLARERGRLALRRGDIKAATEALSAALGGGNSDPETFLLAADAAGASSTPDLAQTVEKLYRERLGDTPEASIVKGKLLLAAGNNIEAETAYASARDALKAQKASPRRIAQANFGLAVIAYAKHNDPDALAKLNLVINDDPSIYDAYLFKADIIRDKNQALEQARTALQYNPDYPRAWLVLGKAAAALGDKTTVADAIAKLQTIAPNGQELKELAGRSGR